MTLEEARQILGVAEDTDARALRRAYLRRVKQHSPERDPEGFMRVRQAFELAGEWASDGDAESQPALEDIPLPRAVDLLPEVARKEAAPGTVHALDDATEQRVHASEALRERLSAAENELAFADVRSILREALAGGHAEFVLDARQMSPEVLSDSQLSDWLDEQLDRPNWSWANLASALLVRGRVQDALRTGLARLAAQHGGPDLDLVVGEQLDLQGTTFTLDLFARGLDVEAARFGDEYVALRDPLSRVDPLRFEALRQLLRVYARLPRDVVSAMAAAVRDQQPDQADDALSGFRMSEKRLAVAASKTLEREAPMLSSLFAATLRGSAVGRWQRSRLTPPSWVYTAVLVGLVSVLRITCQPRDKPDASPALISRDSEREDSAFDAAVDTCAKTPAPICDVVVRFASATDCAAMQRCASEAESELSRARSTRPADLRLQTLAHHIVRETRAHCGRRVDDPR